MCFFFIFTISLHSANLKAESAQSDLLFYKIHGKIEKPIVFFHGMFGSHRYWEGIVDPLSQNHQLILLDLLGFGRSPKPKFDYTVADHLGPIEKTVSQILPPETKFTIVGHSMGALIALDYAIAYPEKIDKLVLINAPMVTNEKALEEAIAQSSSRLVAAMTFNKRFGRLACMLHEKLPMINYPLIRWLEPELPEAVARDVARHTWDSYSGSFKNILSKQDFYELLRQNSSVPTLIVIGSDDKYASDTNTEKLPARKNLKVVKVQGGHNILLQNPKIIATEILKFL